MGTQARNEGVLEQALWTYVHYTNLRLIKNKGV